jgi:hypothetical protein
VDVELRLDGGVEGVDVFAGLGHDRDPLSGGGVGDPAGGGLGDKPVPRLRVMAHKLAAWLTTWLTRRRDGKSRPMRTGSDLVF